MLVARFRFWLFSLRVFLSRIKWPTKNEVEDVWLSTTVKALHGGARKAYKRKAEPSCEMDRVEQREPVLESDLVQFIQGKIE
jgi:hypothetical protein